MTQRSTASIVDRLRRAGTAVPTSPDIESILARAAQRKRRRQIGVTAASVVVVGGLGFSSAQMLGGSADTTINAAAVPSGIDVPTAGTAPLAEDVADGHGDSDGDGDGDGDESTVADWRPTPSTTSSAATAAGAGVTQSVQATRRTELADGLGGAIVVEDGQLKHRTSGGEITLIELPEAFATTERRVTDVAVVDAHPFLLISDFTDRPDLAATAASALEDSDPLHQEVAIYAVDLTTDEVHVVEQRTITDRHSPTWVYNGLVTAQNGRIMVVRELWQSMCVYVESLALDGTTMETPENPLPEPSLASLSDDTIRDMQSGAVGPPRGCIAGTELPDGAMSVLGAHADATALASINSQLRSAAALTAEALDN